MSVYVDDMEAPFGRMLMCHMIADTTEELLSMVDRIGVDRKWAQYTGSNIDHFDIAKFKRALAVKCGAIEITWRQCGSMVARRSQTGSLGSPNDAEEWLRDEIRKRNT